MTIADDNQNPRPAKKLTKSLDAIAALRIAMEKRLADAHREPTAELRNFTPPPAAMQAPIPEPETNAEPSSVLPLAPEESAPSETNAESKSETSHAERKTPPLPDPAEWPQLMFSIANRSQKLIHDFLARNKEAAPPPAAYDPGHIGEAFTELLNHVVSDPERFAETQLALWQNYLKLWQSTMARFQGMTAPPVIAPAASDKRFQDKDWQNVWLFDYLKQSYLLTAQWMNGFVRDEAGKLAPRLAHKLEFYTRQMVDAISPSNFWMTNPEVLRTTLESGGENLVKGLENLLGDLERGNGKLRINMSDMQAFEVGRNLATTPGKVVFQNDLIQLIQYAPRTESVYKTPLFLIPPWINKYYILDLREKNSFVRYLVDQGYTVFCISWVNPTARHALTNFDDYMTDGVFAGLRAIKRITGTDDVNALGYCIGGTLLASALAYLQATPTLPDGLPYVKSATYLVTMIDFKDPGDLGVFIDDEQVAAIEARMATQGYLDAASMATTFNLLRANDLIWSFVVNNYLLGREPFPFDILYWNADSTNLPAVMQSFYLRKMYIANKLVEPNGLAMKGVPIDVRRITTPSFLLATQDDHIAPWRSTYAATQLYRGPVKFVLAGSGHIAGVINHPAANKYGYWTNNACPPEPEAWLKDAEAHKGSWWPEWLSWLKNYAGEQVPARAVGDGIEAAPGSYVKVKAL